MKINTINTKILMIIASAFIIMTLSIYLFASHYLKSMIDGYQESVYSEKIDTILDMLERKYEHLTETFLIDAYEEDFKQSFLEDFRSSYFTGNDQKVYPFILDSKGKCMIDAGMNGKSCPPKEKSFFAEVKNEKKGSFEYAFKGSAYWVIKRHFPQWDWYIGYIVPLSVKYTHFYSFRDILAMIMAVTTVLALFIVSLLVTNFTKPIYQLTKASLALSSGNLDYPMKVNSSDETGILTQSFLSMRDAIRKTIRDLNEKNTILTQEIAERKRIAHALKDSEQRYRLLVENQNDLVIKFDTSCSCSVIR
ncbi:MAG: HAMP domain-containing protein [Candidatus Auribacter fodinae]|uniref:histidine kinase n=1 Tax=Candidatus Auribacter fodinae TaxID=2093366 RepID=A0A3A4QQ17_9BACT|nr:MAG: HAMP domain-containing protein [Candidatus Auribacter fodinae]